MRYNSMFEFLIKVRLTKINQYIVCHYIFKNSFDGNVIVKKSYLSAIQSIISPTLFHERISFDVNLILKAFSILTIN